MIVVPIRVILDADSLNTYRVLIKFYSVGTPHNAEKCKP